MQSRASSLLESCLNVASGFVIAMLVWQLLGPALGYHVTFRSNLLITSIFTSISVVRGYLWRRFFEHRIHRALARANQP